LVFMFSTKKISSRFLHVVLLYSHFLWLFNYHSIIFYIVQYDDFSIECVFIVGSIEANVSVCCLSQSCGY